MAGSENVVKELEGKAYQVRESIIRMLMNANAWHAGSARESQRQHGLSGRPCRQSTHLGNNGPPATPLGRGIVGVKSRPVGCRRPTEEASSHATIGWVRTYGVFPVG